MDVQNQLMVGQSLSLQSRMTRKRRSSAHLARERWMGLSLEQRRGMSTTMRRRESKSAIEMWIADRSTCCTQHYYTERSGSQTDNCPCMLCRRWREHSRSFEETPSKLGPRRNLSCGTIIQEIIQEAISLLSRTLELLSKTLEVLRPLVAMGASNHLQIINGMETDDCCRFPGYVYTKLMEIMQVLKILLCCL